MIMLLESVATSRQTNTRFQVNKVNQQGEGFVDTMIRQINIL